MRGRNAVHLKGKRGREMCEESERDDGKTQTGDVQGGWGLKEEGEGGAGRISEARQKPSTAEGAGASHLHQPYILTPILWWLSVLLHAACICLIITTAGGKSSLLLLPLFLHLSSFDSFFPFPAMFCQFSAPLLYLFRSPSPSLSVYTHLKTVKGGFPQRNPTRMKPSRVLQNRGIFFFSQRKTQIKSNWKFCLRGVLVYIQLFKQFLQNWSMEAENC